jgi:hypothetical protein
MKLNYILKILFPLFFLTGCLNENPVENNFNKYNGTWLWLKTVGGFAPRIFEPEDGITIKIGYDGFNFFKVLRNDSLKVIAHYKIEEADHNLDKISYSNIRTYGYRFDVQMEFAQIKSDTLEMWDGVIDGYFSFYKRVH